MDIDRDIDIGRAIDIKRDLEIEIDVGINIVIVYFEICTKDYICKSRWLEAKHNVNKNPFPTITRVYSVLCTRDRKCHSYLTVIVPRGNTRDRQQRIHVGTGLG